MGRHQHIASFAPEHLDTQKKKKEINEKLNSVDARLGVSIFVEKASIKPDGGIIEVKDKGNKWRIVLVCEAKHQGKDIENIEKGILVGKNNDQELMVAGNAIERSHKNINEIRNLMIHIRGICGKVQIFLPNQ